MSVLSVYTQTVHVQLILASYVNCCLYLSYKFKLCLLIMDITVALFAWKEPSSYGYSFEVRGIMILIINIQWISLIMTPLTASTRLLHSCHIVVTTL